MKVFVRLLAVLILVVSTVGLGGAPAVAQQTQIPQAEYEALVALHRSTDGHYWVNKWTLHTDNPCGLYGVTCRGGHVTQLDISQNELKGVLRPELGNLTELELLWLVHNRLSGAIPLELGNLTKLKYMVLAANQLNGPIPPELGNLASLERMSIHNNQLSGPIPTELGNLADLDTLTLGENPLSGPLPHSLMNVSLRVFYFQDTDLCEPPDADFQAWLSDISILQRTNVLCSTQWQGFLPLIVQPG